MNRTELIRAIDEELGRLQDARRLLAGDGRKPARAGLEVVKGGRKRRHLSPEAIERIREAQRRRWAKVKKHAA